VASGTTAIELVLRAHDIGPGDEVITAANTFVATAAAIAAVGARPVLVDVDPRTANLDPKRLTSAIGPRTRAIVPVHLYGRPAPMAAVKAAAGSLPVIEDAAQAHGARYQGARVGSLATAGCFSFYPTKNLGGFGDGGIVTTDDAGLAERIRLLRDHGRVSQNEHAIIGHTARLDILQAAVLRVQANALDEWNARRRQVAEWYRELLPAGIIRDEDDPTHESVYHLFVVRVRSRDAFRSHLGARGVRTAVHYPTPLHLQPAFRYLGHRPGDFPEAEALAGEVVSLPMHPFLGRSQVQYVARMAAEFLAAHSASPTGGTTA
jgi:dTDP-4-amino-4,6-dideoxygalactose transaminase